MNKNYLLKALLIGLGLGLVLILILSFLGIELNEYRVAVVMYAGLFCMTEYKHRNVCRQKKKEYEEIDRFLSLVRHRYYAHGMVDEAIQDVLETLSSPYMRKEAEKILLLLQAEDIRHELAVYRRKSQNRYLSLFATLCVTVLEYGDVTIKEGSLFLKNLLGLKEELRNEIEADQLLLSKMTGMGIVAAAPAFCLGIIERWSISNLPELADFYDSTGGKTLKAALFLTSLLIYTLLCILRGVKINGEGRNGLIRKIAFYPTIHAFLYMLQTVFNKNSYRLEKLMHEAGDERNVRELYLEKILYGLICASLFVILRLSSFIFKESGISLPFGVFVALMAYFVPNLGLILKRYLNRISMEDEVMQYQTIISMLMFIERISIYEILEELEQFARIFKRSISDCINEMHSGEEEALENLRDREVCPAFQNLSEKLLLCDQIGVRKAFDEVNSDHEFYLKKRDRETAKSINKRAVLGQFIAFVPLVAAVLLFLIIPFAKASLEMLSVIGKDLNL